MPDGARILNPPVLYLDTSSWMDVVDAYNNSKISRLDTCARHGRPA